MSETVHGNVQSEETIVGRTDKPEIIIGLSAYEIAVKWGFVGTEEEWNALIAMKTDIPNKVSELRNDAGYLTENTMPREVFVATVQTTWEELVEAYNQDKFLFVYNNGGFYTLAVYNANNNPPYMSFATFNNASKSQDALDINKRDNKWVFTRNKFALSDDLAANGKGVFIAKHGVTTFKELSDAYEDGKLCMVKIEQSEDDKISEPIYLPMGSLYYVKSSKEFNMHFVGIYSGRQYSATLTATGSVWSPLRIYDLETMVHAQETYQPKGNYVSETNLKNNVDALKNLFPLIKWMQNTEAYDNGTYYNKAERTFTMKSNSLCVIRGFKNVLDLKITDGADSTYSLSDQNIIILLSTYYGLNSNCEVFGVGLKSSTIGLPSIQTFGVGCKAKKLTGDNGRAIDCIVTDSGDPIMNVTMLDIPVKEEMA